MRGGPKYRRYSHLPFFFPLLFFSAKDNLFVCRQGITGLPLVEAKITETGSSLEEKRVRYTQNGGAQLTL